MQYAYPVDLEKNQDGKFTAVFPGLPGATDGATEQECLKEAVDLLVSALSFSVEDGTLLPRPEPANGRPLVYVPVMAAMKFALHDAMIHRGLTNKELGQRLGVTETVVRRLRDPLHESKISRMEDALRAAGLLPSIEIMDTKVPA